MRLCADPKSWQLSRAVLFMAKEYEGRHIRQSIIIPNAVNDSSLAGNVLRVVYGRSRAWAFDPGEDWGPCTRGFVHLQWTPPLAIEARPLGPREMRPLFTQCVDSMR